MSLKEQLGQLRHQFNPTLAWAVGVIAISQFNFGFDQQAYSTTQAMDRFERRFGTWDPEEGGWTILPYNLSLLNSLPYIGFVAGLLVGSEVSARFGRRMVMFVMSVYALCTAAITLSSTSFAQILAARILNYGYVGMELAVVPVFQAEIVPKKIRGVIVETYQLTLYSGGLVMGLICFGTQKLDNDNQWRIPFGLFFIIPTIVACSIWFIPESPRWLLLQGREQDALQALTKFRAGSFTPDEIADEMHDMRAILALESDKGTWADLWKGPDLKRTCITVGVNFFLQLTGNTFASKYGTVYIKSLGAVEPFVMTVVNQVVNLTGVVLSMILIDRVGRRPLLLLGSAIQLSALYTMAGLGVGAVSHPTQVGIVAMLSVFGFGFSIGWAPISHILSAEIPSTRLRDKTYRTASTVNILVQFAVTFSVPYLLDEPYAALGSKVGFIYGTAAVFAGIFAFFCVPECKGRTLEEIGQLFLEGVPVRKFTSVKQVAIEEGAGTTGKAGVITRCSSVREGDASQA